MGKKYLPKVIVRMVMNLYHGAKIRCGMGSELSEELAQVVLNFIMLIMTWF